MDYRPEMIEFVKRFEAKFGKQPESWSSYYYDMVYAAADAITKANSDKREDIAAKLLSIDVPSVIYPKGLQFDAKGRVVNPVTFIYELNADLKYKMVYLWEGTPPYKSMTDQQYNDLIKSLSQ
jgi:branched-chain amino acid transport system substrate-binding protein